MDREIYADQLAGRHQQTGKTEYRANRQQAREHGCRATDHFAGFRITGRFHIAELVALMDVIPDGITEFMCHPGRCTDLLRNAPTRLKESRERELEALNAELSSLAAEHAL